MTTSHFKKKLIHTCTIQSASIAQSDSGEPIHTWANAYVNVRCRFVQKQERIASEGLSLEMIQNDLLLFLASTDVSEEDRITDIKYFVDASLLDAGPFSIEKRMDRHTGSLHHISVEVERIE